MGGRLDDGGAAAALPALGHVRPRLCARRAAGAGALVSAVAIWTVAERKPGPGSATLPLSAKNLASFVVVGGPEAASRAPPTTAQRFGSSPRRRVASVDPEAAAFSYQARAWATSALNPSTLSRLRTEGSYVWASENAARPAPESAARVRTRRAAAMSPCAR